MAFLDYMGVPVRRASERIPTSAKVLEMAFWPGSGLMFPLITQEPEHLAGWEWWQKLAPSMAFLDYMGVPVRRASERIPTSAKVLEMAFWPGLGLAVPLITQEPEHLARWGRWQKLAPSMAFLDYMVVPVRRASERIPTSAKVLEMAFWPGSGLAIPLITQEPEHLAGWGGSQKLAPSMAFLDYMGVPARCASERIPTSAKVLEMAFWPGSGLAVPLITQEPEHLAGWGRWQKLAPSMAFLDYMGVPVRRASERIPTFAKLIAIHLQMMREGEGGEGGKVEKGQPFWGVKAMIGNGRPQICTVTTRTRANGRLPTGSHRVAHSSTLEIYHVGKRQSKFGDPEGV